MWKIKKFSWFNKWDLLLVLIIFIINLVAQFYGIGKNVNIFTDEGIYLYAAKLVTLGFIPYKDFFLIHLPLLIYINAFILTIINFNMGTYHFIYIFWVFSTLFPIYFIVLKITKNRLGSFLAILLFSTFTEMVQWDAHFFAMRQGSLPFIAWCLFFIFIKPRYKIAGVLLFLFAACLLTNLLLAIALLIVMIFVNYINSDLSSFFYKFKKFIFIFFILSIIYYLMVFTIPNSFNNIINYQLDKNQLNIPISLRLKWLFDSLPLNWPILIFGLLGLFVINRKTSFFSLFNLLSFGIIFLLGKAYYSHYITILGFGLSISAGIFFGMLIKKRIYKILCLFIVIILLFKTNFDYLKFNIIDNKNSDFFSAVEILKNSPDPLFTLEPIYAMYANKNLTFHYFVADMRSRRVLNKNLASEEYYNFLNKSNTVVLEPFSKSFIPTLVLEEIRSRFYLIYNDDYNQIYIKNKT